MTNRILRLKKVACAAGIVLLMAGTAQADVVINFSDANAQEAAIDNGVLASITEPATDDTITSLVYTVSGLTIDTDGVANDTATFTIPVSSVGAGPITWDQNPVNGAPGVREFDYNTGTFNNNAEGITFGAITVSGTGSGGQGYQLNSALYTEVTNRRWTAAGGDESSIAGSSTNITSNTDISVALNDTFFTQTHVGGAWNVTDVNFTVDVSSVAVPEPSSLALLVAGLGLIGLRRRRLK